MGRKNKPHIECEGKALERRKTLKGELGTSRDFLRRHRSYREQGKKSQKCQQPRLKGLRERKNPSIGKKSLLFEKIV